MYQPTEDIILRTHADGLGDSLIYSTLPERFAELGHKVYVHVTPGSRNPGIRDLLWVNNPFIEGYSDREPNAGSVLFHGHNLDRYCRLFPSSIEGMEILHGLEPRNKYPKIYYEPKLREDVQDLVIFDTRSVSQPFSPESCEEFIKHLEIKLNLDLSKLRIIDGEGGNGGSMLAKYPRFKVNSIYEWIDVLYSAAVTLTTESGSQAVCSAIKRDNQFPIVYSLITTRTYNHKLYTYPNIEYVVTSKNSPDFLAEEVDSAKANERSGLNTMALIKRNKKIVEKALAPHLRRLGFGKSSDVK